MNHVAARAPTGELLPSPSLTEGKGQPEQTLNPYGLGIDCHSRFFHVCLIVAKGTEFLRFERRVHADWRDLRLAHAWVFEVLSRHGIPANDDDLRYTLESTSHYHMPLCIAWKGRPSIINPADSSNVRRKTDVLDARKLAYHSLTGLWRASWLAPSHIQELRVVTLQRAKMLGERSRLSNRINNDLLRFGHTVGQLGPINGTVVRPLVEDFCRNSRVHIHEEYFSSQLLPAGVKRVFAWRWARIDQITSEVKELEKLAFEIVDALEWNIRGGEVVNGKDLRRNLETVPGVGPMTVITWLAEVGDITRFSHVKQLCAYAGLDPSLQVSADKVTSRKSRKGNARLNAALRQSARAMLSMKFGSRFTGWVRAYLGRNANGGKGKALKAIARRLCKAMFYVHLKCEPFDECGFRPLLSETSYPICDVEEMGFSANVVRILKSTGLHTSKQVVEAFFSDLARRPGCGETTIHQVSTWISHQSILPQKCVLKTNGDPETPALSGD